MSVYPRLGFLILLVSLPTAKCALAHDWMLRVMHQQQPVEGKPLRWDTKSFTLLARDGRLLDLEMQQAQEGTTIRERFSSYSQAYMRAQLTREFGPAFEVQGTGHYLVVQPAGQHDWADRFERLYREMLHYFGTRGIPVRSPAFPLVAVVFPTQGHFLQYAAAHGGPASAGVLGYYNPESNRILLYDVTAGGRVSGDWRVNAETIVHEAAHQTAFNVGIHSRYCMPPRWVGEGLGAMFEAPGIYSSSTHPKNADRVNQEQLATFRAYFKEGIPDGTLAAIVASDEAFRRSPYAAYGISWSFTFMMAETSPGQLSRYLQVTAQKEPFAEPTPAERIRDFQRVFGDNFKMLQARLERFVSEL